MEEKLSSPPRHSALAWRARLPCTLCRDPWGSEASPGLHRHRGGPNFKNAPAVPYTTLFRSSQRRLAQWERKSRGGRGLLAPWHGRKVEFSSPTLGSGLPCPSTVYTPP